MGKTGEIVTGMVTIGTTGTAIGITVTTPWSLLAISGFQDGGAGAGDTPMDITGTHTVITGMAIRTVMVMATADMDMDTVTMATATAMDTATAPAASPALVANMVPPLGQG
jgi:hypothetical protein